MSDFDYVAVGHVTVDVIAADGSRRPGGGAFYSALQAARLGLRTQIITMGAPGELKELLEPYRSELDVLVLPAPLTTTFDTRGTGAARRQRVLAWAGAITEPVSISTSILHFAPVARETPNRWRGEADFVGATPQGLVRKWDQAGEISLVPLDPAQLPDRCAAVAIGEVERESCARLISEVSDSGMVIAVTAGSAPTTVYLPDGGVARVDAFTVAEHCDDLGAGDVFAAAFFVALRDGLSPAKAAAYGNSAAAVRVDGVGPQAIGARAAIEARMRSGGQPG